MAIPISSNLTPGGSAFPVTEAQYVKGAQQIVADNTARDALVASRRSEGQVCYCLDSGKSYRLVGGVANGNWVECTPVQFGVADPPTHNPGNPAMYSLAGASKVWIFDMSTWLQIIGCIVAMLLGTAQAQPIMRSWWTTNTPTAAQVRTNIGLSASEPGAAGIQLLTTSTAGAARSVVGVGEQATNTTAAGWRMSLGLDPADPGALGTNWLALTTAGNARQVLGLDAANPGTVGAALLTNITSAGARSTLGLSGAATNTAGWLTSADAATARYYLEVPDRSLSPTNYLGAITALDQDLGDPTTNESGWYGAGVAGTLSGPDPDIEDVEIGDTILSDGTAWLRYPAVQPVTTLTDVLRTNVFQESITAGSLNTNTVGDTDGSFDNTGIYSTIPGYGSFFNTNDLTPFSAIILPNIKQSGHSTNIAFITVIVRNGKDSGSDIVAISRIEADDDTSGLIAPLTNHTSGAAMTVNAGDLTQPFLVAFLPWSADGTPVDKVARPTLSVTSTNYQGNSFYRQGTNYAGTWSDVTSDYYIPFKFLLVTANDPSTNYVMVNGRLPAAITNELHTATSDVDALDARISALGASYPLALPATIWAVEGIEAHCYFAGLIPGDWRDWAWDATATGNVGTNHVEDWRLAPSASGNLAFSISQYSRGSTNWTAVAAATNIVTVAAADATGTNVVLAIGDSTTDAANWLTPMEVLDSADSYVDVTSIGTQLDSGIYHEGHSGWTAATFVGATSPFWDGAAFSTEYYLTNNALATPTHIIIKLGINDLVSSTTDSAADTAISTYIGHIDMMLASFTNHIATVKIGICLVEPCSRDQDAWGANYGSATFGLRARRNYWKLNQAILSNYSGRTGDDIYVLPTNVCIDDYYGYSRTTVAVNSRVSTTISRMSNGVHPSGDGYEQIADCIWAWLKNNP